MKKRVLLLVALSLLAAAIVFLIHQEVNCHFRPMTNFKGSTVRLDMDLDDAVVDGIYLPSARQTDDGSGLFAFRFVAPGKDRYYKLYYQNESYKFPDTSAFASENFYGSWEDVTVGFKPVEHWIVRDSLRIVGNPRDEHVYYGVDVRENIRDKKHVDSIKQCKDMTLMSRLH